MQNLERYFGFKVILEQQLKGELLTSLKRRAALIAYRYDLDPNEYYVYIHALSIMPDKQHFARNLEIASRLGELRVFFEVNPKQQQNGAIRFCNHLFGDVLEKEVKSICNSTSVTYFVPGLYLEKHLSFKNSLITFVSKSLRNDHRKIKVSVTALPTKIYSERLKKSAKYVTKLDLDYEKYTPITLPQKRSARRAPSSLKTGAPFVWRGPARERDLHSFLFAEQPLEDLGELRMLVQRSTGVCRIEAAGQAIGTGFLIASDLVLTNFHVLSALGSDLLDAASRITFRFGCVTGEDGEETQGIVIKPGGDAVLRASHTEKLDYVLLQLQDPVEGLKDVAVLPYETEPPTRGSSLTIIQHPVLHPKNNPMKLTRNPNGVTGVYRKSGRVQYVTRASPGSSGSPCLNANWKVVAIHHAEETVAFGKRREGILISAIYPEIHEILLNRRADAAANPY